MPTFSQHIDYWNRIRVEWETWKISYPVARNASEPVGYCYITDKREIGIHIDPKHQGRGYGPAVVAELIAMHPGERLLANVAPTNTRSQRLFEKLGFKVCQWTYELTAPTRQSP